MDSFAIPLENPEKERLERLAERALAFAVSLDLSGNTNLHIYRALDAERVMDQATRQRLIPEIKKILQWHDRPESKQDDHDAPIMVTTQLRGNDEGAAI
jgi:hypothetical protein